jgi:hypothetical protein
MTKPENTELMIPPTIIIGSMFDMDPIIMLFICAGVCVCVCVCARARALTSTVDREELRRMHVTARAGAGQGHRTCEGSDIGLGGVNDSRLFFSR